MKGEGKRGREKGEGRRGREKGEGRKGREKGEGRKGREDSRTARIVASMTQIKLKGLNFIFGEREIPIHIYPSCGIPFARMHWWAVTSLSLSFFGVL